MEVTIRSGSIRRSSISVDYSMLRTSFRCYENFYRREISIEANLPKDQYLLYRQ